MLLEAPVEGATAESQRLRGMTDVAAVAVERLLNQQLFYFVERHVVEGGGRLRFEAEVHRMDMSTARQQRGTLDGVVQLPDITGPGMALECGNGVGLEPDDRLPITLGVAHEEMMGQRQDV